MYLTVLSASQTAKGDLEWQIERVLHSAAIPQPDLRVTFCHPHIDGFTMARLLRQLAAEVEEASMYAVATGREPNFG